MIIDGGSTDCSADYVNQQEKNITYWMSEPDKGIYNAMNKGVKAVTGDYLLFLNSGDYLAGSEVIMAVINEIEFENAKHNKQDVFLGSIQKLGFKDLISSPEVVSLFYTFKSTLPHQGILCLEKRC